MRRALLVLTLLSVAILAGSGAPARAAAGDSPDPVPPPTTTNVPGVLAHPANTPTSPPTLLERPTIHPWSGPEAPPAEAQLPPVPPSVLSKERINPELGEYKFQHDPPEAHLDIEAVMRRVFSTTTDCYFRFDVANHSDKVYDLLIFDLTVVQGLKELRYPQRVVMRDFIAHENVQRRLKIPAPCETITAIRLREAPLCMIDGVHMGDCRTHVLMRSLDRISFGL
jgi:hypothetical protein